MKKLFVLKNKSIGQTKVVAEYLTRWDLLAYKAQGWELQLIVNVKKIK